MPRPSKAQRPLDRRFFEDLYGRYSKKHRLAFDPLILLDPKLDWRDFEIWALIVSGLAYGRVPQIQKSSREIFSRLHLIGLEANGAGLHNLLTQKDFDPKKLRSALRGWVHRLNTSADLIELLQALSLVLAEHGDLRSAYLHASDESPEAKAIAFAELVRSKMSPRKNPRRHKKWEGSSGHWFLPSPKDGGACKRYLLWLRWMMRKDEIDPGTWLHKRSDQSLRKNLFCPIDTHVYRFAFQQNITQRKSINWGTVKEITEFFKEINPEDPVKYDFAIFQFEMERNRVAPS